MSKKVVINTQFGGFGISDIAYEKLIEWGVPVQQYIEQKRDPITHLYLPEPRNDGDVIFDRSLSPGNPFNKYIGILGRYWETWLDDNREHPLLIKVVEELGEKANAKPATLKIVEIPDDIEYEIEEYDGNEHIAEKHKIWS